jgi:hypothetical protein
MFAVPIEEEAEIAAADEEHLMMMSCLMVSYPAMIQSRGMTDQHLASRDRGWEATAFSIPTTLLMTHCTARWYFSAVLG